MSRKRFRPIASGQGWVESSRGQLDAIRTALTSPQPESVIAAEGSIRVRRLPHVEAWGDQKRTNVSGKLDVKPIGRVKP